MKWTNQFDEFWCVYTTLSPPQSRYRTFPSHWKFTHASSQSPQPSASGTTNWIFFTLVLPVLEFYINGIRVYILFGIWLLLLIIILTIEMHHQLFVLFYFWVISHNLFIHSPVKGRWLFLVWGYSEQSYEHLWIYIYVNICFQMSHGKHLEVELLGHELSICLTL